MAPSVLAAFEFRPSMLHYTVKKLPTSCWNNLSTRNISGTKQQRAARKRDNKSRNARLRGIYIVDGRIDTWIKSFIIGNESRTNRVQSGNTGKTMLPHTKELWARESFPFRDRETHERRSCDHCAMHYLCHSVFRSQCGSTNQNALLMQMSVAHP